MSYLTGKLINMEQILEKQLDPNDMSGFLDLLVNIDNKTFTNENVQKLIMDPSQKFDVVIVEWLFAELAAGYDYAFYLSIKICLRNFNH